MTVNRKSAEAYGNAAKEQGREAVKKLAHSFEVSTVGHLVTCSQPNFVTGFYRIIPIAYWTVRVTLNDWTAFPEAVAEI
jgi:hypothetical protein